MTTILLSGVTGAALGAVFQLLHLPVPAPTVLAGAVGVVGVTLGALAVRALT